MHKKSRQNIDCGNLGKLAQCTSPIHRKLKENIVHTAYRKRREHGLRMQAVAERADGCQGRPAGVGDITKVWGNFFPSVPVPEGSCFLLVIQTHPK